MDSVAAQPSSSPPANRSIDIGRVLQMLPHRYPFLLLDRVVEVEPGGHGVGIKNVTFNEPFFQGHFPGQPVMPGVLVIEAMAQASAVLVFDMLGDGIDLETVYFMSVDAAKFRRPVVPGDTLRIQCRRMHSRGNVHRYKCTARVDGTAVAEAQITAMIIFRRRD